MEKIRILSCDYDVIEVDHLSRSEHLMGQVDYVEQVIKLERDLKDDRKAEVLLHEVLHCVFFSLGDNDLEEAFLSRLSAALAQVLRDNPDFTGLFLRLRKLGDSLSPVQQRNYHWFKKNLNDLCLNHGGDYLIIYKESVRGVYPTHDEAFEAAIRFAKPGEFLIQHCIAEGEETVFIL